MGRVLGVRRFQPFLKRSVAAAALVTGGGVAYVTTGEETCVRVPSGVAALSEPAFSALKADEIQIESGAVLGWHYTIHPDTGKTGPMQELWSKLMITAYGGPHGDLIEPNDLEGTTGRLFFVRTPDERFDHKLVDWRELKAAGYEIKSTSDALESCDTPQGG